MMQSSDSKLHKVQYRFTNYIRNPNKFERPHDVEFERMQVYRDLFFKNVAGFLERAFPVLKKILQEEWLELVQDYFETHKAHTPFAYQMAKEFVNYLESERPKKKQARHDPPFLAELAHYEWLELAVEVDPEEINFESYGSESDMFSGVPVVNPTLCIHQYSYPVHNLSPEFLPKEKPAEESILGVYRHAETERAEFIELNTATWYLLELLRTNYPLCKTGKQSLEEAALNLQHPNPQVIIDRGKATMEDMLQKTIILGTTPSLVVAR